MTGSVFLEKLLTQLDFLPDKDRETVVQYYRDKLSLADTISDEEELVNSFGEPEEIVAKLREALETSADTAEEVTEATGEGNVPGDIIFSKPPVETEIPEIIHSLEGRESFNLYGEKVVVAQPKEPEEPLPEEEDDLTPEELEQAKAETLEKAEMYRTDAFNIADIQELDAEEENAPAEEKSDEAELPAEDAEEEEHFQTEEDEDAPVEANAVSYPDDDDEEEAEEVPTKEYPGLFRTLFPAAGDNALTILKVLLSIVCSPLLVVIFGVLLGLYAGLTLSILLLSALLCLVMVAFIVAGVVELVYGIAQLFSSVPAGLIEIGLGTILFSIVTAVVGLIYELIFGVVPRTLKALTALFKKYLRLLAAVIYGGRA